VRDFAASCKFQTARCIAHSQIEDLNRIMDNIISDLRSLQFDCFLTDNQLQLSHLRMCSHALTYTACAQATFLVSILRDARLVLPLVI